LSRVGDFIDAASSPAGREGTRKAVHEIAARQFPESLGLGRLELLRGDVHMLWVDWFLESVSDPQLSSASYASCYKQALTVLDVVLPTTVAEDRHNAAKAVAEAIRGARLAHQPQRRRTLDRSQRDLLLLEAGSPARCWVCGVRFTEATVEAFANGTARNSTLPSFVDYLSPRGMKRRDLAIEVDHVVPISRAGADETRNMRLACGWCNAAKSDRVSLYEAGTKPKTIHHPRMGPVSVPLPYWVVRVLQSSDGRCEANGCQACSRTEEMLVAVRFPGAPTPPNLSVFCREHDPLEIERLVPRKVFAR
jgi:hypothetical protein